MGLIGAKHSLISILLTYLTFQSWLYGKCSVIHSWSSQVIGTKHNNIIITSQCWGAHWIQPGIHVKDAQLDVRHIMDRFSYTNVEMQCNQWSNLL